MFYLFVALLLDVNLKIGRFNFFFIKIKIKLKYLKLHRIYVKIFLSIIIKSIHVNYPHINMVNLIYKI